MGAYDNPQAVRMKIDQGARNIAQFFTAMKGVGENIQRQAARDKREAEKATAKKDRAKREKDVREGRALSTFDKDYAHIESLIDQIGGDFDVKEGKNIQDDAIMENLIAMRTKFLAEISSPDIGAAEISKIQAQYNNRIATFKEDMDNFIGGYRVYKDIKERDLDPKEEDAILSHGKFAEMIDIYESIHSKKGDVGIYPSADGNTFNIGKFNKGKRENEAGEVLTGSSLTEYRKYAQKNGKKNPKFFEQVEVFSPPGYTSRADFIQEGLNRYKNSDYNFSKPGRIMLRKADGSFYPKLYASGPNKDLPVEKGLDLDVPLFEKFLGTDEGKLYVMEGIKGQDPQSVWVGLGNEPADYDETALIKALGENLIKAYNNPQ
tara:strand:+ start:7003 stop:8133 length:1131 start_codon:yes stop_codon:yes gene_type:complete